jgi:hypothetical protein
MPDEDWIQTLEDGRKVKFTYQELPEDKVFVTAQIEVTLTIAPANPPQVRETRFAVKWTYSFAP